MWDGKRIWKIGQHLTKWYRGTTGTLFNTEWPTSRFLYNKINSDDRERLVLGWIWYWLTWLYWSNCRETSRGRRRRRCCQSHRIVTPPTCVICIWLAVVELDCVSHVLCISVSVATNQPATCMADSSFELFIVFFSPLYGDGAGNTVEENYSIFSLIRMR